MVWVKLSEEQMDDSLDRGISKYLKSTLSSIAIVSGCNIVISVLFLAFTVYPAIPFANSVEFLLIGTGIFGLLEIVFLFFFTFEFRKFKKMSLFEKRRQIFDQRKQRSGMICPTCLEFFDAGTSLCKNCGEILDYAIQYSWHE